MTFDPTPGAGRLRTTDYGILILLCAALYAPAVFGGRPLSVHEARLPQLAREMAVGQSDWILPQSGGRPWLERPPLPHWFTAGAMKLFGRTDSLWTARLPAAVMGGAIVVMGAWMAARWFGREIGLLAGVVLATTYELYQYATLAEDDIYLGAIAVACMALFVKQEWPSVRPWADVGGGGSLERASGDGGWSWGLIGPRPWPTVLFFVLLGLTNLAKGPLVGALPIVATIGVYLLWNCDVRRIRHYAWLWGLLIFLVLTAAWPWWAQRHYPDIWDNWRFDYLGQFEGGDAAAGHQWDEPWWYYPMMLPLALAPWSWATVIGLFATARRAWKVPRSPERLLWCWAWMGLIVLSLPARKHHHYLVPVSTPWAILGALGLLPVARALFRGASGDLPQRSHRPGFGLLVFGVPGALALALLHRKMPGGAGAVALLIGAWMGCVWMFFNGLSQRNGRWLVGAVVAGVIVSGALIQIAIAGRDDATLAELKFLRQVEAAVPAGEPVLLNSDIGSLKFFRLQFYLQREGRLLHNLSFLRNQGLAAPVVYVITRAKDQPSLERIGTTQLIAQTDATRRERSVGQRFSLFRVTLSPDLRRYETPSYVGVMQAMGRKRGPWCGDDWGKALPGG